MRGKVHVHMEECPINSSSPCTGGVRMFKERYIGMTILFVALVILKLLTIPTHMLALHHDHLFHLCLAVTERNVEVLH